MLLMMLRFLVAAAGVLVTLGCGGQAGVEPTRRDSQRPGGAASGGDAGAGEEPAPPAPPPTPPTMMEEPSEPPPFIDPGCPPVMAAPADNECDPLASDATCPVGQSCFPYVLYPSRPCEVEQYGARCQPVGPGGQGDPCSRQGCAAEHICISTGRGTQCARLCSFSAEAPDVCAPGLLCLPIDIEGFGGCL
jgi:hypothetical protein